MMKPWTQTCRLGFNNNKKICTIKYLSSAIISLQYEHAISSNAVAYLQIPEASEQPMIIEWIFFFVWIISKNTVSKQYVVLFHKELKILIEHHCQTFIILQKAQSFSVHVSIYSYETIKTVWFLCSLVINIYNI